MTKGSRASAYPGQPSVGLPSYDVSNGPGVSVTH